MPSRISIDVSCLECDGDTCSREVKCRCGTVVRPCNGSPYCERCQRFLVFNAFRAALIETRSASSDTFSQTFDKSQPVCESSAYAKAREWHGHENVFIHGPVGTGKTFLARCLLNRGLKLYCRDWFAQQKPVSNVELSRLDARCITEISAGTVCRRLDAGYKSESPEFLIEPCYLFVDDLDKSKWTPKSLSALFEAIDARHRAGIVTVFTTNFPPEGLVEWWQERVPENKTLGPAIVDRQRPALVFELEGDSLRTKEGRVRRTVPL